MSDDALQFLFRRIFIMPPYRNAIDTDLLTILLDIIIIFLITIIDIRSRTETTFKQFPIKITAFFSIDKPVDIAFVSTGPSGFISQYTGPSTVNSFVIQAFRSSVSHIPVPQHTFRTEKISLSHTQYRPGSLFRNTDTARFRVSLIFGTGHRHSLPYSQIFGSFLHNRRQLIIRTIDIRIISSKPSFQARV